MYYSDSDDASVPATQIYVYPTLDATTGELVTAQNLTVDPAVQLLYNYILQRGTIIPIENYNRCALAYDALSGCLDDAVGATLCGATTYTHLPTHNIISKKVLRSHTLSKSRIDQHPDCVSWLTEA